MTEKLYDIDSHLAQFEAKVLSCKKAGENYEIILDKTAFFPEGGGQSSDIGFLNDIEVFDVQEIDGEIIHFSHLPLKETEKVKGKINFERRFDFMQQHSGEHIVSGIAHSLYGCENVGFHLSEDIVTLDFDKILTKEQLLIIENLCNETVLKNKRFFTYYPEKEKLSNLKYRSKKELKGDIRIVEIEDTDMCACCAPHVKSAAEIGIIKLLDTEKIRGGIRIELKCGKRALLDYNDKYNNVYDISCKLAVKQTEAAEGVDKLLDSLSELKLKLTDAKRQIISFKVSHFNNYNTVTAVFEEDFDIKELQHYSDALFKTFGGIRGVFSPSEDGFFFAVCGEEKELNDFFSKFKSNFTVKGGGRNSMVQGTVFTAKENIIDFFENN